MVFNRQEILVDRFDSETGTFYQFYGYKWHGYPGLGTANDRYPQTMAIENQIRSLGYNMVSVWECSHPELSTCQLHREFVLYPQFTVYNFKMVLLD